MKILQSFIVIALALFSQSVFASSEWPRLFENADGSFTKIESQPKRILSTSVTITGTLLAIDAPVTATATAMNGKFFEQWANFAKLQKLKPLWPAGTHDLEMVYSEAPDLIVVAATGGDAVIDILPKLQKIAPTIVLDYSNQSWQSMAIQLGQALGTENKAVQSIDEFNRFVAKVKREITIPEGKINVISYEGAGALNYIAQPFGAHATLLKQLGFELEAPNAEWQAAPIRLKDFLRVQFETLTLLKADTTFILEDDNTRAEKFKAEPILVNVPSVVNDQVYGLGKNSFRIDRFSAVKILSHIHTVFSNGKY